MRRPPRSTRTDTLIPYTTLFRSALIPVTALHYCDAGITQKINLSRSLRSKTAFERRRQPMKDRRALRTVDVLRHHRQIAQVDRVRRRIENQTRERRESRSRMRIGQAVQPTRSPDARGPEIGRAHV